jgi:nitrate reductase NapAB chaperone NapD
MKIIVVSFTIAFALSVSAHARAQPLNTAVFDFEMIDTSLEGEMHGARRDEQIRLNRVGDQLRKGLAESGKFIIVDIAPVEAEALKNNLQACGGCDVDLAQRLGADLAITGTVQKVSNLILNMNVYIRDVHTGKLVISMSADLRGNTDESWSRAANYLLRNRLLEPDYGVNH